MKNFRLLNSVFGWVAFAIAAFTYLSTLEPTASFWDCGEFISAAYKFDVGHPPGAPFFMLTAKFFTLFTSDVSHVAYMINMMSGLMSAFTILFLFWTITYIGRKIVGKRAEELSLANGIAILGAGMVGALAYTFSDTFWFSAVEAEVYAYSSFFTAIVFWLILKWDENADRAGSDRWLILIAYLMGLSIGVHLLNLLVIPAIVLVYYFRKYETTFKGVIIAAIAAVAILAFVNFGLIPGSVYIATQFELFCVNSIGMPYNSGVLIYLALAVISLVWAIVESGSEKSPLRMKISYIVAMTLSGMPFVGESPMIAFVVIVLLAIYLFFKKEAMSARWLNTSILMVTMLLVGYSSYSVIMIRSSADPTMDQNSPDNIFSLQYYLNRQQYGDTPLLYGATYNAPMQLKVEGDICTYDIDQSPLYAPSPYKDSVKYVVAGYKYNYKKQKEFMMFFPRMYSSDKSHISGYKMWGDIKGKKIYYDYCGEKRDAMKPTFGENLKYFFNYQINFMYWRYFMWNFSGRQNDIQGYGEIENGNWITGIKFLDNILVGDQTYLPKEMKENKGRNVYYMLPLLLGLLGIFYMVNRGKEGNHGFWIVLSLFIMTGLAIVVYLNQTPYQPRERDYAYAGSFYAFSIWIGLGVMFIYQLLSKFLPKNVSAIVALLAALFVPLQMVSQTWDDHDRSGRYTCRDFGQNYLNSCEPNAILFSNGDNDTFPLWYNQEVEGVRTDVRVCNLSYLPTDWYIDQMKREAYKSAPLPISWEKKDYISGTNDVISAHDILEGKALDMHTAFDIIKSDDPGFKDKDGDAFFPTTQLNFPINADEVVKTGTVSEDKKNQIVSNMVFDLNRNTMKGDAMVLEMIKENNWKRPMYICTSVGESAYPASLKPYFERTGLAMQILPITQRDSTDMNVNVDKMYDNMMHKFKFGGIENPKVYIDETIMRMCRSHRLAFNYLATALIKQNDTLRAKKALEYCEKVIPSNTVPHDYSSIELAANFYQIGMNKKAEEVLRLIADNSLEHLKWFSTLKISQQRSALNSIQRNLFVVSQVLATSDQNSKFFNEYYEKFNHYATMYGAN